MKRRIRVGHLYDYGHDCARAVFNARFLLWNHVNFGESAPWSAPHCDWGETKMHGLCQHSSTGYLARNKQT